MGARSSPFVADARTNRVLPRASLQRNGKAAPQKCARHAPRRIVIGPAIPVEIIDFGEAVDWLCSTDAFEAFSPLTGEAVLVVDVTRGGSESTASVQRAFDRLQQIPCPAIAVGTPNSAITSDLAPRFDVHLKSDAELPPILEGIAAAPLAAGALVQLLRLGGRLDLPQALLAESLVYSMLQSGPEFAAWLRERDPKKPRVPRANSPVSNQRNGDSLLLTLDDPQCRNAFSAPMRDALCESLQLAVDDPSLTRVEIRGAGPDFCSGGDLSEFGTLPDPATAHAVRQARNPARLLAALSQRVTVHVHGACVGAGIELPAFAQRVVAQEDAQFWLPELRMGLVPGAGGTASLPRRIGRQRTTSWILSGERIDAPTALRWGLIDEIEPPKGS